jgi:integrase
MDARPMTDSKTRFIKFADAEIVRSAALPGVSQLRDPRHPALLLRFRKDRARASWHIVRHVGGKSLSTKLGNWPDLKAAAVLEMLPRQLARLTDDGAAVVAVSGWGLVADLLRWYEERTSRLRSLSSKRRGTVRSLVACQLLPRLGSLRLDHVDYAALDSRLVIPMQDVHSLAYTRQAFGVLKRAFKQAATHKMISVNPLSAVVFTDFIDTPVEPKASRLRPHHVPAILSALADLWKSRPADAMLALLMLCHGTRISETRLTKWVNIQPAGGEWFIPGEDTKNGNEHRLPITRQVADLLALYASRQQQAGYSGAYLFPRGDGKPWTDSQGQDVFERIGAGEWSSHDLRKVARSMWADLGVDYLIGELLLNHALKDLDAVYIHTHATTLKRDALERWHTWLDPRGLSFFATRTEPERPAPLNAVQANNCEA